VTTWTYPALVDRIVDGDTFRLTLDLGLHIYRTENVRIAHINAPELSTLEGKHAAAYVATLVRPGDAVTFFSAKLDKYGRPLGTLTLPDGRDFGALMLEVGHAVPYEG
jgi:endonuclease YncB( thermonuclease family)